MVSPDSLKSLDAKERRIRPVIYVFILFEMVMLLQTTYSNLGTIVTGALSGLLIMTYLMESHYIKKNSSIVLIFCYAGLLFFSTIFRTNITSKLFQFFVYVILFILLTSLELNDREARWILNGFVIASIFYSIMIILYRINNPTTYIHSRIVILGSEIDPNYIGLPLIVSFSILFYEVLHQDKKILKVLEILILTLAVLLTSSRGNFLSLAVCVFVNILFFLKSKTLAWYRKLMILVSTIIVFAVFYNYASSNYNSYLMRIFSFSSDDISNGRYALWNEAFDLLWANPIFGGGYEALGRAVNKGAHNTYVQLLCDTGIIGFAIFISFLFVQIKKSYKHNKCLFIGLIGLLCHSFFLGAISSRCFWVTLIMIVMIINYEEAGTMESHIYECVYRET
ncbi:O-antigen ligase family protein [Sporofaciens sp. SGI.106]|uniref:O-antigen ligase family protein n=1 Tax=Sporofaciens sp. SGI.106 TaxID=3420568 RepID=UPI003D07FF47